MPDISSYAHLEAFGRERLSQNFFMREFLHSEIAAWHHLRNVPDFPDIALDVGRRLCGELLEPLQNTFGRIHVRSGYRSPSVNRFGNENGLNCATNEKNFAGHIWDYPDADGSFGATACIVIPALVDYLERGGNWTAMAWWIHDNLPYSALTFFSKLGAFNISWHEKPLRQIDSYAHPKGCMTKPGRPNHAGNHESEYRELLASLSIGVDKVHCRPRTDGKSSIGDQGNPPGTTLYAETSAGSDSTDAERPAPLINYRALHTKTAWRTARGHISLENAIYGNDGAAGLFARKVRIDYEHHGAPLYVVVWQTGLSNGMVIRPDSTSGNGIAIAEISAAAIEGFEAAGGASVAQLEQYF